MADIVLRGLCWDHPRCVAPMAAAAHAWSARRPQVTLHWDARPLAAFNDQPVADIIDGYDLVFVDHPTIPEAVGTGCLRPLDGLLDPATLAALARDSLGGSHESYGHAGRQWALAVDAACQVAAVNPRRFTGQPPATWDAVLRLAARGLVAIPLYPSDAIISLISMSSVARSGVATSSDSMSGDSILGDAVPDMEAPGVIAALDRLVTEPAVEVLAALARTVDPRCFDLNPPALLDAMASDDPTAPGYAPLTFGYTDYQRPARRHRLAFTAPPTMDAGPAAAVLGGAGLAVPATSSHPHEAAEFAAWVAGHDAQRDIVCVSGGQPANARVWWDPAADALVGGFFSGVRQTMRAARTRPRVPWWPRFQQAAGVRLAAALRDRIPAPRIHADISAMLDRYRAEETTP
ncbi:extracellular solute-binding protein [Rugosimonospora africana]|uniref:Membrane protein n=1 Tax=Rugosimonospora africana TaxID=556532 RepID=A0A8J3VPT2_9ACTN|nr:extracellular solute-binding protein [Rugosimonospora africana]GIH14262.1 membrane protein [Rugosimonospora africana]